MSEVGSGGGGRTDPKVEAHGDLGEGADAEAPAEVVDGQRRLPGARVADEHEPLADLRGGGLGWGIGNGFVGQNLRKFDSIIQSTLLDV